MVRAKLTKRMQIDVYDRVNKKPKTLLSENELSVIYDRVNGPVIKFKRRTVYPFKRKTLPSKKTVNITKNGQVIKTINEGTKYKYFTGRNRLMF